MIRDLITVTITCLLITTSCSTRIISTNYYQEKKETVDSIESRYEKLNARKPFAIAFTDKKLNIISIEMISDTLTRIYEFNINEKRLSDSLIKYDYDTIGIY